MRDDIRVREDVRLEDGPMLPLACGACDARVEVRKSSWDQTSVQWHAADVERCVERRATGARPGANGAVFVGCTALRAAVREAAVRGDVPVLDD